jgi:hypothetical protein
MKDDKASVSKSKRTEEKFLIIQAGRKVGAEGGIVLGESHSTLMLERFPASTLGVAT